MQKASIEIDVGDDGTPASATATTRVGAPAARVWSAIADVDRYPSFVPMLASVRRDGERVTVHLKVKIAFFTASFHFVASVKLEEGRWLELRSTAGEPRDMHMRFDLTDGGDGTTTLRTTMSFDPFSLGWMTKYLLKHHPEIRYGLFPGCAYGLADSMKQEAERRKS
jgi:ribosome-associated toxin RatA of RatAB toxin-antitoxin module